LHNAVTARSVAVEFLVEDELGGEDLPEPDELPEPEDLPELLGVVEVPEPEVVPDLPEPDVVPEVLGVVDVPVVEVPDVAVPLDADVDVVAGVDLLSEPELPQPPTASASSAKSMVAVLLIVKPGYPRSE
jgi:hypothetical protein